MKPIAFLAITFLLILTAFHPAAAESGVEVTSIFSDENSMDVTLRSGGEPVKGQIVFTLTHDDELVETQTLDFDIAGNTRTTKVIMWETRPNFDTYVATADVYVDVEPETEATYPFSYGFVVLPRFQVVDLSADSSGVKLLVKPRSIYNPAVADFMFQLIRDGNIIYTETKEDVTVIQSTQVPIDWPILLDDNTDYLVRVKAFSHTPDITSSYATQFTSAQDVEIDDTDVDVDDFGVSVTLYGRSQVPFDGEVEVHLLNGGDDPLVYSGSPEVLTLNRDDTVGIIWDDMAPGYYHVYILVKTLDGTILDRYETVLLIPESVVPIDQPAPTPTPGFGVLVGILSIITVAAVVRNK